MSNSTFSHSAFGRDFNKSTLSALLKKGVRIAGKQAMPAYEGDVYFTGCAYQLVTKTGKSLLRTHSQVLVMAKSSWMPDKE
jgi:hypothetical protein